MISDNKRTMIAFEINIGNYAISSAGTKESSSTVPAMFTAISSLSPVRTHIFIPASANAAMH